MLWYIVNFLSDGRLIKIVGQGQAQYIPLIRNPDVIEYDIIVDDTPTSPNMKEQVWGALMAMMPILKGMPIPPQVYIELLKYSPLPETLTAKLEQMAQQMQGQQQDDPKLKVEQIKAQATMARAQADIQGAQIDQQTQQTKAQAEDARSQADVVKARLQTEELRAKIENLRAAAVANLAKAGIAQQGQNTTDYLAQLDMLDQVVQWHQSQQELSHNQTMAQQQHQLAAASQEHAQGMAEQQHALARRAAMQPQRVAA
jgi:hypothetical protein